MSRLSEFMEATFTEAAATVKKHSLQFIEGRHYGRQVTIFRDHLDPSGSLGKHGFRLQVFENKRGGKVEGNHTQVTGYQGTLSFSRVSGHNEQFTDVNPLGRVLLARRVRAVTAQNKIPQR